jgi:hypothetical protein
MRYGIALTGIAALTLPGVPAYGVSAHADPLITTIGPYGYAVTGSTYTSTTADWTMPTLKCTTSGASIAVWTGLDGYSSPTVEQIGAEAVCESGTAEYFGWYDMYPGPSVDFSNALLPGDKLDASVSYASSKFTLTLQDVTQGWTKTVVETLAGADRSSAETIVEVPSNLSCTPHETLASFTDDTVDGAALGSLSPIEENGGSTHITVSAVSGKTFAVTCT